MGRQAFEFKDEGQIEKEEIANEKEELHEIFDYLTTKNKNNKKKQGATGESFAPVNLHELVRSFKHENEILTTLDQELGASSDLRSVSKKIDSADFENETNKQFNHAYEQALLSTDQTITPLIRSRKRAES